jgi:hypothetical protein
VHSFFWSAATIMYFLLRRSDDGTDFDQVYLPEEEEQDELLSLVGEDAPDQEAAAPGVAQPAEKPGEQVKD